MPIINASSIMVTVLMGKLNTSPRQAHFIFCLFSTLCKTPMMLTDISTKAAILVANGNTFKRNKIPSAASANAYT